MVMFMVGVSCLLLWNPAVGDDFNILLHIVVHCRYESYNILKHSRSVVFTSQEVDGYAVIVEIIH